MNLVRARAASANARVDHHGILSKSPCVRSSAPSRVPNSLLFGPASSAKSPFSRARSSAGVDEGARAGAVGFLESGVMLLRGSNPRASREDSDDAMRAGRGGVEAWSRLETRRRRGGRRERERSPDAPSVLRRQAGRRDAASTSAWRSNPPLRGGARAKWLRADVRAAPMKGTAIGTVGSRRRSRSCSIDAIEPSGHWRSLTSTRRSRRQPASSVPVASSSPRDVSCILSDATPCEPMKLCT